MVKSVTSSLIRKPKTQAGKRFLEKRASKIIENPKSALFVRGGNTSETVTQCLKDWYQLKKPLGTFLKRKNPFLPFEDDTPLEKFCQKYDSSLFLFGSHSKKRPNNLVIGRMYDFHLLDMFEFGVSNFASLSSFKVRPVRFVVSGSVMTDKVMGGGIKPCLVFSGEEFQSTSNDMMRLKNLLCDFFQGERVDSVRLEGVELLISFTLVNEVIYMRTHRICLKASGSKTPRVELEEIGPRCDLTLRRKKLASDDLFKLARKQPKELKKRAMKNLSQDVFGSKLGRVHVGKQDVNSLQTRKMKSLKRLRQENNTNQAESNST